MITHLSRHSMAYVFALCASILISVWACMRETVINPDGICYVMAADVYLQSGFKAAMHYCPQSIWPFYSILIAFVTQWTPLSPEMAAYWLTGLFSFVSVFFFLQIIKELGGSPRIILWAMLVILLSHEFNSVRQYIVRDHGFWAGYLLSLWLLLRFMRSSTWFYALSFSASLMIAGLFRVEAIAFLFLLPWLIWFDTQSSWRQRLRAFFMLNSLSIVFSIGLMTWLIAHTDATINQLGRLHEFIDQLQNGLGIINQQYQNLKLAIIKHVLPLEAARDAGLLLAFIMICWYLWNVIGNLSWIYSVLVIYAWRTRAALWSRRASLVLYAYLLLNLLVTAVFFLQHLFLSRRYLIVLSLILMLWMPFALDRLWQERHRFSQRIALYLAGFFIFISALGGLFDFGYSKAYIHDAGTWVAKNVPKKASLYVNDYQLMYYTQHFGYSLFQKLPGFLDNKSLADQQWKQYDYLVLRIGRRDETEITRLRQAAIPLTPIQTFMNKRGDKVVIYQVKENVS